MNIKVIYSSGGKYNKNREQKIADGETIGNAKQIADVLTKNGHTAEILKITPRKIDSVKNIKTDIVFNLVEWSGKDYPLGVKVIKNMELSNIPHTGADSKAYEWCCDKISMKKMFDKLKISTPPWTYIETRDSKKTIEEKIEKLAFPIIIKPAYEHCTIGITSKSVIKKKKGAVNKIINLVSAFKEPVLVEEFIKGREFSVTVVKNHRLHVFPPTEIKFKKWATINFLSFKTQWMDSKTPYSSVVIKDKKLSEMLKKISRKIFIKTDCKGYVRIDARFNGKKIYILEININPDLSHDYDYYSLAVASKAAGWGFEKLVNEIANAATNN